MGDRLARPASHSPSLLLRLLGVVQSALGKSEARPFVSTDRLWMIWIFAGTTTVAALWWRLVRGEYCFVNDEYAYLLQARMLLDGKLSWPTPPLAGFFEAPHVLVSPAYSSKYFPGQALLIAPFLAFGVPWLGPCVATGLTAALIFFFLRGEGVSRASASVGVLSFALSRAVLDWSTTYLSHSGTIAGTALVLVGLQRFLRTGNAAAAGLSALGVTLVGICRPVTGIAVAVLLVIVLVVLARGRRLPFSAIAAIGGLGFVAIVGALAWSASVTGEWGLSPWGLWARQYTPFDGVGFGPPSTAAPLREIPANLNPMVEEYRASRERYLLSTLPSAMIARGLDALNVCLGDLGLFPLAALGVVASIWLPGLRLACVLIVMCFLSQMSFHAFASQYLSDLVVGVCVLLGGGAHLVQALVRTLAGSRVVLGLALAFAAAMFDPGWPLVVLLSWGVASFGLLWLVSSFSSRVRWLLPILCLMLSVAVGEDVFARFSNSGGRSSESQRAVLAFEEARRVVSQQRGLLFVRHSNEVQGPLRLPFDLTLHDSNLFATEVVVAVDKGEENGRLVRYLRRPAWVFDAKTYSLEPWEDSLR